MIKQYDVVIVGGGMVGISLACLLDRLDLPASPRVLLIEEQAFAPDSKPRQPGFDVRTTALSQGTVDYFKQMGLWDHLQEFSQAIHQIQVTDQGRFGSVNLDSRQQKVDALGYVVENHALGRVLNQRLLDSDQIELLDNASVSRLTPEKSAMQIEVHVGNTDTDEKSGHTQIISGKLVVLADGGRSGLCEKLGIHRQKYDYGQTAIITNVSFSHSHQNIAFERFTENGPMALLPLGDFEGQHRSGLIWTRKSEDADELLKADESEFLSLLQKEFGFGLGEFLKTGKRASFPLSLMEAEEQVRPHLVLLGNVAHALHPVAGQGFNLGFRNTIKLAASIQLALHQGGNPGDIKYLAGYLDEVEKDQFKTINFSHGMTNLFSSEKESYIWLRKLGLFGLNLLPAVRRDLGTQAMGLSEKKVSLGFVK